MDTLCDEISALKSEIEGYKIQLQGAESEERLVLLKTISSSRETLNRLYDEKKALQSAAPTAVSTISAPTAVLPPASGPPDFRYFEISAKFKESKSRKAIRATVFKCAEKYHGRYLDNVDESIFYPTGSNDLQVHLRFEEKRDALDFLVELSRLGSEHHRFRDMIEFEDEPQEVSVPNQAKLIYFGAYLTNDTDSPECLTLNDLLTEFSKLTTVVYDPTDPRIGLSSLENFSLLPPQQKLYKCHIASKSGHKQYAKDVDNNIIYATQDFHNYFDGMQTDSGEAEMALQFHSWDGEFSVPVDFVGTTEKRYKMVVRIIFRDEAIAAFMKSRFRDCMVESPLELLSYLFVKDQEIAKTVLEIKYRETMAQWMVHSVDSTDS